MFMETNYHIKHTPMKTLTQFLVVLLCTCTGLLANAQCGVQAFFTDTVNPNMVPMFLNQSTVSSGWGITGYSWSFGDGSTSTQQSPTHVYQQPGNYNVCLVVTAQTNNQPIQTCTDTFCSVYSNCNGMVQASFTYQTQSGVVVYTGTATSNYPPIAYNWTFQGGNPPVSTTATTTVQYNSGGVYQACLTATDANGCATTTCQNVAVTVQTQCNGIQANFTENISNGSVSVQSTSTNTNGNTLYRWFMDGMPYTNQNPNTGYTFQGVPVGLHNICLYVYASQNIICDSICKDIFVPGAGPCSGAVADFSYTATNTTLSLDAHANHYPVGTQFQWWLNGNGSTPASGASTYLYQNLSAGTYQICLYIYDANSNFCDSSCQTVTIGGCNVNMSPIFTASTVTNGTIFAANGNPSGTVYQWIFGDGTTGTTTAPQTFHQYPTDTNTQVYTACLVVSIPGTVCVDSFCTQVVVPGTGGNPGNCQANFTWTTNPNGVHIFANTSQGNATAWAWDFGDGSTSSQQNPNHYYASPGVYWVCLSIFGANNCVDSICQSITVGTPGSDTICGTVFNDGNGNGVMDNNEMPLAGVIVMAGNYTALTDSNGFYQIIYPGTFAVSLTAQAPQGCLATLPLSNSNSGLNGANYYILPNSNLTGCGYNFGFNCNVVTVCGLVYFDANNNGMQDNAENGLPGVHVTVTGNNNQVYHAYTDNSGSYCVTVPTGTYVVSASGTNYNTCSLTPTQLTVAATNVGQTYGGNNFAIYCQPGSCNLQVTLTPHTTVTPGFQAWYDVQVHNIGATIATGTANLFYDANLSFINANPVQSSHNASTQTLSFNLPNLMPGQSAYYYVKFNAPQSLALNTPIFNLANVIAGCSDVNLTNNVDTIHQTVTGSWDPNNKLAYVTNYETNPAFQLISSIEANQRIEYVINFQNEGNGPAVNVVVKDLISSDLDISSFELLGVSHNCQVTITGNDANFKFSNIMLPAKVTDEPNSHGFIKFAINAINNLPAGHVIADDAAIYFDFNEAVVTNESEVTMLEPSNIDEVNGTTATIAPNPMNQYATIRLNNNSNDGFKLRVTDVTGRVVSEYITSNNNLVIERNGLSAGMYTYQVIQNNKAVAKGKLVIQ